MSVIDVKVHSQGCGLDEDVANLRFEVGDAIDINKLPC